MCTQRDSSGRRGSALARRACLLLLVTASCATPSSRLGALVDAMPPTERDAWMRASLVVARVTREPLTVVRAGEAEEACGVVLRGPRVEGDLRADRLRWCEDARSMLAARRAAATAAATARGLDAVRALEPAALDGSVERATLDELYATWAEACRDVGTVPEANVPTSHPVRVACDRAEQRRSNLGAASSELQIVATRLVGLAHPPSRPLIEQSASGLRALRSECVQLRALVAQVGPSRVSVALGLCASIERLLPAAEARERARAEAEAAEREARAVPDFLAAAATYPCGAMLSSMRGDARVRRESAAARAACEARLREALDLHGGVWIDALVRRVATVIFGAAASPSDPPLRVSLDAVQCASDAACLPCRSASPGAAQVRATCGAGTLWREERVWVAGAETRSLVVSRSGGPAQEVVTRERGAEAIRREPVRVAYARGTVTLALGAARALEASFTTGGTLDAPDSGFTESAVRAAVTGALDAAMVARADAALARSRDGSLPEGARLDAAAEHLALGGDSQAAWSAIASRVGLPSLWGVWESRVRPR